MATAVTSQKIASREAFVPYDHDPGTTDATITSPDGGTTKRYLPIANYEYFAGLVMTTVASGGVTLVEIVAATDSAGTNVTAVKTSGAVVADAVGDYVFVECTAAQIKEVGDAASLSFTHFGIRITCSNSGDEACSIYIREGPRFSGTSTALTATTIS